MISLTSLLALQGRSLWLWRFVYLATLCLAMRVALAHPDQGPDWFPQADKLRHAIAFAGLWFWGLPARIPRGGLGLVILLIAFGGAVEIAQGLFTTDRDASWLDLLADATGVVVAAITTKSLRTTRLD